jgi:NAD(P)-dependent dehydrogenase (short-subunit alcohol dehydrogenase family)
MQTPRTVIITGASQGIGACLVMTFMERGYNVVATSRSMEKSGFQASKQLALVDGDIGEASTARQISETTVERFGGIDTLVNDAGVYFTKPFIDFTSEDIEKVFSINLYGFIYLSQLVVTQMLKQKTGGSVVSISASLANHPIAGVTASVPMITKGGIESISKNLAMEYAKDGIRFNTVAPGVVETPLHQDNSRDYLRTRSPMASIADAQEIVDAVVFLAEARHITGEVLHVDGGAHVGKW